MRVILTYCETEHPVPCNWMLEPNKYPVCTEEFDIPQVDGRIVLKDGCRCFDDVLVESPYGRYIDTETGKRHHVCTGHPETMKLVKEK